MTTITIHSAQDYSPEQLMVLFKDVYIPTGGMCESLDEKYPDLDAITVHIHDVLERPGAIFLIAENGTIPIGFLSITPRKPRKLSHTADLSMGLTHSTRGRGTGKLLLQAAMQQIRPPVEIIYLMVRADNPAAIRLYQSAGFVQLARLEDDTRTGTSRHDGLLMRARITHRSD